MYKIKPDIGGLEKIPLFGGVICIKYVEMKILWITSMFATWFSTLANLVSVRDAFFFSSLVSMFISYCVASMIGKEEKKEGRPNEDASIGSLIVLLNPFVIMAVSGLRIHSANVFMTFFFPMMKFLSVAFSMWYFLRIDSPEEPESILDKYSKAVYSYKYLVIIAAAYGLIAVFKYYMF